jgi:O-acetyl-ADP-ribose deacetylase (regulator of RNase III)
VAFPAVSAGVYGWPAASCARIAVNAVRQSAAGIAEARFVLFSEDIYAAFERAAASPG